MTDQLLGAAGLGLVWGWWLVLVASPVRAGTLRATSLLGSLSLALGVAIALLVGPQSVLAATIATALGAAAHLAFKGALRQRRHRFDA